MIKIPDSPKFIIVGLMPGGKKFRPSDWAERMCGSLSTFRNRRIYYSPLLRPAVIEGIKCVIVDKSLQSSNTKIFEQILDFVEKNQLTLTPHRE
ncbi:MAG: DUF3579 domain-containing protein [Pseudomonadota bacterium]